MKSSAAVFSAWRFYLMLAVIGIAITGLAGRVFDLAILDQHFLRHQGDERVLRLISTPAFRGMILDRNNFPLAVSTTVYSVWMNPQEFNPANKNQFHALLKLLQEKPQTVLTEYHQAQKKKREFLYLKRALSPELANQIKKLKIPGIYLQEEYKRYYPEGEVAAHVIGFTNIDDSGQEGLELGYNQWLSGEPGKKWVIKDRIGRIIADVQNVQDQKAGRDLVLSIDRRVQYLAYRELLQGVRENKASSGSVVVIDVKTGEVLAMVNQPAFNPNHRIGSQRDNFRNRAVTDIFEPGSTVKAFTVASVFDKGTFTPGSVIDTTPGWIRVGRNVVRDEHNLGPLTVTQIVQHSSNVGISKIIATVPPNHFFDLLHRIGYGEPTNIGFPGEQGGILVRHDPWSAFGVATLAFGYGLSITTLQLAQAYTILANDGVKIPLSLLRLDAPPKGERVMNARIAKQVLTLLESVLNKGGTGVSARVTGYRVAGKTGTAKLIGAGGYEAHRYNSTFVGIAPLSNPRYVIAVMIHDPQGKKYYGGDVSGPVFSRIMQGLLRMMDVPPDDLS